MVPGFATCLGNSSQGKKRRTGDPCATCTPRSPNQSSPLGVNREHDCEQRGVFQEKNIALTSRKQRQGQGFGKWAWVDSNYRPHAYQAVTKQAKSRQDAAKTLVGRTVCRSSRQTMPEDAGIYRHTNRPKRHTNRPNGDRGNAVPRNMGMGMWPDHPQPPGPFGLGVSP